MQRVSEIIGNIFNAAGQFIKVFTIDLFHAIYFKALEFDQTLQDTKTTMQRFLVWSAILGVVIVIFLIISHFFFQFINNLGFVMDL